MISIDRQQLRALKKTIDGFLSDGDTSRVSGIYHAMDVLGIRHSDLPSDRSERRRLFVLLDGLARGMDVTLFPADPNGLEDARGRAKEKGEMLFTLTASGGTQTLWRGVCWLDVQHYVTAHPTFTPPLSLRVIGMIEHNTASSTA